MEQKIEIYVRLLDEGVETMRPTQAVKVDDNLYKLLPVDGYDPEDEIWEFLPGSIISKKEVRDIEGEAVSLAIAPEN